MYRKQAKNKVYRRNKGFTPYHFAFLKSGGGFTLIELMVAFVIFVLITGAAFNLLVSGISNQRNALAKQILIDQTSFFTEYMNRALRQAQKDLTGSCLTGVGSGYNYEVGAGGDSITFIDRDDKCRRFLLEGTQIKEQISTNNTAANLGPSAPLTSDDLEVVDAVFADGIPGGSFSQTDNQQPRVTFTIDVRAKGFETDKQPALRLQTTVSQRHLDVKQ